MTQGESSTNAITNMKVLIVEGVAEDRIQLIEHLRSIKCFLC